MSLLSFEFLSKVSEIVVDVVISSIWFVPCDSDVIMNGSQEAHQIGVMHGNKRNLFHVFAKSDNKKVANVYKKTQRTSSVVYENKYTLDC